MENELNKRINRLENGRDQAIEKKDMKEELNMRLIKEENSDKKIINSDSINNLKEVYKLNSSNEVKCTKDSTSRSLIHKAIKNTSRTTKARTT